jgi:hypothetical protein
LGRFHRFTFVVSPHAQALAWLIYQFMDRVLWRGLPIDKYSFIERLGTAALEVLETRPRALERT